MSDVQRWTDALEAELGLPPGTVDVRAVLDLARDAAHAVARPAAPVTTYAVGFAEGLAAGLAAAGLGTGLGGSAAQVPDAAPSGSGPGDRARALAERWPTS